MKQNIPITTSGSCSVEPVLMFCQQVIGVDRMMYSMDYPFQFSANEVKTVDNLPHQRCRQEEALSDQCGAHLQAVSGGGDKKRF